MLPAFLSLLTLTNAFAAPGACTGACWTHDTGLIQRKSDGKYFRYSTGDGILITTADSIQGPWTDEGYVLPGGSSIDLAGNTNLWAPDLHYTDGTYYMYYAVSTLGSQVSAIGVASSPTMEVGSWTDHGSTGIVSDTSYPYNAIDPNWVVIGSTPYLNFGSYWDGIYQVEMASDLLVESGDTPRNIAYNASDASGNDAIEASSVFEYEDYYYLLFSSGQGGDYNITMPAPGLEYHIAVCRSATGTGGYVDQDGVDCTDSGGSVLLASHGLIYGPGGQGVLDDTSLGLVLYYQYSNIDVGIANVDFMFGWNVLSWSNGWPVV